MSAEGSVGQEICCLHQPNPIMPDGEVVIFFLHGIPIDQFASYKEFDVMGISVACLKQDVVFVVLCAFTDEFSLGRDDFVVVIKQSKVPSVENVTTLSKGVQGSEKGDDAEGDFHHGIAVLNECEFSVEEGVSVEHG